MIRLVIPSKQQLNEGDNALIHIMDAHSGYFASFSVKVTEDTSTASYDTACNIKEFNPFKHGFVGINEPLCKLLIVLGYDSEVIQEYIMWTVGVDHDPIS